MCEILHGYNPLAMHQTMSTWGMICTPKEWKTPSSYSSVRHLQRVQYYAGRHSRTRIFDIPRRNSHWGSKDASRSNSRSYGNIKEISQNISEYLRVSISWVYLSTANDVIIRGKKKKDRTVASSTAHSSLCVGVEWEDTGSQPALAALQFTCDSPESILVSVATETQHTWMGI